MADFKDRFSGKVIRADRYSSLSASLAAASDNRVDGRIHEFLTGTDALKKLPYRLQRGDQAKFFPGLSDGTSNAGIETGSDVGVIRDTERGIVYVPIKKKNYQKNLIGVGSHISTSFASSAYLQISAAFAEKFTSVGDDTLFTFCVEEFYTSPSASRSAFNVGPLTASYSIFRSGSTEEQFSCIHNSVGKRDFEFNFPTENFITHWDIRFGGFGAATADYSSSIYVNKFFVRFNGSGSETGSDILSENPTANLASGSHLVNGVKRRINPSTDDDGFYHEFAHKTRLAGDADSGSLYESDTQFPGHAHIIIYPPTTTVSSADFQYHATVRRAATGSSTIKTLYFYSGSGAGSEADPDYGFYVSESLVAVVGTNAKGTPVHQTNKLRRTADVGYYSPSGSQYSSSIYVQTASGATSGKGPVFAQLYETGN